MEREAWIDMPSAEEAMKGRPPGGPYDFGFVPKMGRLLMAHPRLGPPFLQLFGEIMFAPGALTRRERELVAAVTAAGQDCFY